MNFNPEIHYRESMRYPGYDYSSPGYYFITICIKNREYLFGDIVNDNMQLSEIGNIALQKWYEMPIHFNNIILDEFVVMPNHIHGIIQITNYNRPDSKNVLVGVGHVQPLREQTPREEVSPRVHKFQHMLPNSISTMVGGYKFAVTKWCNENEQYFSWQRNFYDTIIDTDEQLEIIRNYIRENPRMWKQDSNNKKRESHVLIPIITLGQIINIDLLL